MKISVRLSNIYNKITENSSHLRSKRIREIQQRILTQFQNCHFRGAQTNKNLAGISVVKVKKTNFKKIIVSSIVYFSLTLVDQ